MGHGDGVFNVEAEDDHQVGGRAQEQPESERAKVDELDRALRRHPAQSPAEPPAAIGDDRSVRWTAGGRSAF